MGQQTKIEWCDHTFNAWIGCTKVAPECQHCYAEAMMDDRLGKVQWGPRGTRVITSAANWAQPLKWSRAAAKAGVKRAVFCASLADVFKDNRPATGGEDRGIHDLDGARAALWALIEATPHLVWLLLTKRPQNINAMVPPAWLEKWPENVWTGGSAGSQPTANIIIPPLRGGAGAALPELRADARGGGFDAVAVRGDWEDLQSLRRRLPRAYV